MTTSTKQAHVSEKKVKQVSELVNLIKNKQTILLVSIKSIPASQYQELVKKFRGRAVVKVPKKSIISRALDSSSDESVKKLKEYVQDSTAILFSDEDSFEISAELLNKKTPIRAKPGQIAPEDIIVQAGPTELVPGPAISELGAVGIQIQIEKGKINIKESKILVKKDQKISQAAADIMGKLDIKPFSIGFVPVAAFDSKDGKIYLNIKINREETISQLKNDFSRALPFAVQIGYISEETIRFLLSKAYSHERALEKFAEKPVEEEKLEVAEDTQTKSGEEK